MTLIKYVNILTILICFVVCKSMCIGDEEFESEPPIDARFTYKIRCTRRFNPGNCVEPVVPVWTFIFQNQNCSERLGCLSTIRSNRFPSYRACVKHCQPLVDIYLLTRDKQNLDPPNFRKTFRDDATTKEEVDEDTKGSERNLTYYKELDDIEDNVSKGQFYKDYIEQNTESNGFDESMLTPDIDYVDNAGKLTMDETLNYR